MDGYEMIAYHDLLRIDRYNICRSIRQYHAAIHMNFSTIRDAGLTGLLPSSTTTSMYSKEEIHVAVLFFNPESVRRTQAIVCTITPAKATSTVVLYVVGLSSSG